MKKWLTSGILLIIILSALTIVSLYHPANVDGDFVGISLHNINRDDAQVVVDSGARWIRIDVNSSLSRTIPFAKVNNLKVLGILDSWMYNESTVFNIDDWKKDVHTYVNAYKDYVDAWEIWNEPAHESYPLMTQESTNVTQKANNYYEMVLVASPIIRQIDPSATIVLFGGMQLYPNANQTIIDKKFVLQLSNTNISLYGDAFSVHAYPWGENNDLFSKYEESLGYYKSLFPSLEMWLTETGKPIEEGGENCQAQYLGDALEFFQGKVERFFWYSLHDNSNEISIPKHFGLLDQYDQKRSSYFVMQKLLA